MYDTFGIVPRDIALSYIRTIPSGLSKQCINKMIITDAKCIYHLWLQTIKLQPHLQQIQRAINHAEKKIDELIY